MFSRLPRELQQIICEYANVKYRNGKFMNQISKTDRRYNLLQNPTYSFVVIRILTVLLRPLCGLRKTEKLFQKNINIKIIVKNRQNILCV